MPKMMKAIQISNDQSLVWEDYEKPEPSSNEVLIKISATAINRADLVQRNGGYPPPPGASSILGLECAGEVVALGDKCQRFREGDQVCALLSGGGYAEYATVDEGSVLPVPQGLSYREAAGIPEVFATAWLNLFIEAGLRPGEKVVLHAGASGVGTAAIQMCRISGVDTFVTVGNESKLDYCLELGATAGFNRHNGSFVESVQVFAPNGVDVILDPVGASYLEDNLQILRLNGRLVLIGLMSGAKADINLASLMIKRVRLIGSTLRARPIREKAEVMRQLEERLWPAFSSGEVRVTIDSVLSIAQAEQGHTLIASDQTIGKVILEIDH